MDDRVGRDDDNSSRERGAWYDGETVVRQTFNLGDDWVIMGDEVSRYNEELYGILVFLETSVSLISLQGLRQISMDYPGLPSVRLRGLE